MKDSKRLKNCFSDKATLIARKMIAEPENKWTVRDFAENEGISIGLAQGVLESMSLKGYSERIKNGPNSYSYLTNKDKLLSDWTKSYRFDLNEVDTYYSPDKNILKKVKKCINEDSYALTLHTGANLFTSFAKSDQIYLYLDTSDWQKDILKIRQKLELKELVRGGNFHIIRPYYKNSLFYNCKMIKGFKVVSPLQLYLDLYNFQPRGQEHAEYLKRYLEERGKSID